MHPEDKPYFEYLKKRSLFGALYRNWILYPRLSSCLEGKVLDYGCGIGDFLKFRPDTVGVDINTSNIGYCKSLGLEAELLGEDGRIPFEKASFSGVTVDNVIEHIPAEDVDGVIDEIVRVLEPGGIVVVGVPGSKGYASDSDHKVFYTEEDLIALFKRNDFGVIKTFRMPLPWKWLDKHLCQYCVYTVFRIA